MYPLRFQTHSHQLQVWKYASRYARLLQLGTPEDGKQYKLKKRLPPCYGLTTRAGILYVDSTAHLQELDANDTHESVPPRTSRQPSKTEMLCVGGKCSFPD